MVTTDPESTYTDERDQSDEHDHSDEAPCPECDLSALDDLECEVAGVTKRAEIVGQFATKLAERRASFDQAREEYATARAAAAVLVDEAKTRLGEVLHQLACKLPDADEDCLKQVYAEVWQRLRECRGPTAGGCCIEDDCEFVTEIPDGTTAVELRAWIADIERRAEVVEECFDGLVTEPAALSVRAAERKADVDQLAARLGAELHTGDATALYAEALTVQAKLEDVWFGFDDARSYIDCLCRGLTCSFAARQALALLHAQLAILDCRDGKAKQRCEWLEAHLVEEILAVYVERCGDEPDNGTPPSDGEQTGGAA